MEKKYIEPLIILVIISLLITAVVIIVNKKSKLIKEKIELQEENKRNSIRIDSLISFINSTEIQDNSKPLKEELNKINSNLNKLNKKRDEIIINKNNVNNLTFSDDELSGIISDRIKGEVRLIEPEFDK